MLISSAKLERWLGPEAEHISRAMRGWYGPPIAVARVPGRVFAMPDGDFSGTLLDGRFDNLVHASIEQVRRAARGVHRAAQRSRGRMNMGFSSLSDMVAEMTAGKRADWLFQKVGPTGVANATSSLWGVGNQPAAGANAGNAPGGTVPTSVTTGAFPFANVSTDTQHFVKGEPLATVSGNTLLLYDRLFAVNKTINSTATEAVTGVPSRYTNQTATAADYIGGNFLFVEVGGTPLAATAHNWTVCTYTNQAGTAGQTLPSLTGNSGAIIWRLDHPTGQWFASLATGDVGIKALTQMQCSALVATGVVNFVIGHPIAMMPCPIASMVCVTDGVRSAVNLARVFDNACLSFLEICKPSTTATTYTGMFTTGWG